MKPALALSALLLLSACGFKLRGTVSFPPWFTCVAIQASSGAQELVFALKSRLEGQKIRVLTKSDAAPYWLVIEDQFSREQITAVSSTTVPRQYQLYYKVQYRLVDAKKGKELIPPSKVSTTRQLTVNNNLILGSDNEEKLLYDEMRAEAAMLILSQLSHHLARIVP